MFWVPGLMHCYNCVLLFYAFVNTSGILYLDSEEVVPFEWKIFQDELCTLIDLRCAKNVFSGEKELVPSNVDLSLLVICFDFIAYTQPPNWYSAFGSWKTWHFYQILCKLEANIFLIFVFLYNSLENTCNKENPKNMPMNPPMLLQRLPNVHACLLIASL